MCTRTASMRGGILVIGAGIAGLYTALRLAPHPVTVITSGRVGARAASSWAQGGLAAAMGPQDSAALHVADTVAAGAGLVDSQAAHILCTEGPTHIGHLQALGVPFDRDANGTLKLGREAAHGLDRIVHVGGDEAGATIMRILMRQALAADHIQIIEQTVAYELLSDDKGVCGAKVWNAETKEHQHLTARQTILATGGAGGLFSVTTNPLTATGQGLSLAHRAGATLRDLEFVQFHPTALNIGKDPAPLATEALRGEGATLHDAHGRRFMPSLHPDAELAPRDIVARGVAKAIAETGEAFLDAREAIGQTFRTRFPTVYAACQEAGLDPAIAPMPIAPAAHYHMGGVLTDTQGQSTRQGLWAVGEVASTGVHGANRLASNSLLEALVFGARIADALRDSGPHGEIIRTQTSAPRLPPAPAQSISALRHRMSDACGLLRDEAGLGILMDDIAQTTPKTIGDDMALEAMTLVVQSARARHESRGAHQRTDFPETECPAHSLVKGETLWFAPHDRTQEDYHDAKPNLSPPPPVDRAAHRPCP